MEHCRKLILKARVEEGLYDNAVDEMIIDLSENDDDPDDPGAVLFENPNDFMEVEEELDQIESNEVSEFNQPDYFDDFFYAQEVCASNYSVLIGVN